MTKNWTKKELTMFSTANDFMVSPFYSDGETLGTPTFIWSVVVDEHLYIRAYNGKNSRWYKSAVSQKSGKIFLAGDEYEVDFSVIKDNTNLLRKVDNAYESKYANDPYSAYINAMTSEKVAESTLEVIPK